MLHQNGATGLLRWSFSVLIGPMVCHSCLSYTLINNHISEFSDSGLLHVAHR